MHAVACTVHFHVYSCTVRTIIGALVWPRVVRSRAPDSGSRITGHGSIQRETPMHNLRGISRNLAWPTDRTDLPVFRNEISKMSLNDEFAVPKKSVPRRKSDYCTFVEFLFFAFLSRWKLLNDRPDLS